MQLTLTPELERYVEQQVSSGRYYSAVDVLAAALERMQQDERIDRFGAGELDALIAEGEKDLQTGNTVTLQEARDYLAQKGRGK